MFAGSDLLLHFAGLFTNAWMAGLWQGAALMGMGFALVRLMPRASAGLRHSLLLGLFLLAAALPWVHPGTASGMAGAPHGISVAPWIALSLAALWVGMVVVRAAQLGMAWKHLSAVRRRAVPLVLSDEQMAGAGSAKGLLYGSRDVDAPMVLGFWRPRLLVPATMAPTLTAVELRQITLHECEHLRRHDDWTNLLLQVVLMLFPLHPGLAWLYRHIRVQRELACDAAVVSCTAEPLAYATCLTRLAEQRMQRGHLRLALAAWERKSELVQRVHALLRQPAAWSRHQSGMAAGTVAALLVAASVGMARVPQLVSVAGPAAGVSSTVARAESSVRVTDTTVGVRMMPAALVLQGGSGASTRYRVRQKHSVKTSVRNRREAVGSLSPVTPRLLRTSTRAARQADLVRAGFVADEEGAARFVTTEFSPAYVAVPTAAGWLVIQL